MKTRTVMVVGLARSGKDTAANIIAEKMGCKKFVLSDILAAELKKRNIKITKKRMSEIGEGMRKEHGMAIVAEKLMKKISPGESAVISGARSVEEVEYIKSMRQGTVVLEIFAGKEERFVRRSGADSQGRKEFFERDRGDIEGKGLKKVLENANFRILNNSSMGELRTKIVGFIHKI